MKSFVAAKRRVPPARRAPLLAPSLSSAARRAEVRQILYGPRLQPKLTVGAPDDEFEREADRVADQVMRMPDLELANSVVVDSGGTRPVRGERVQRLCKECEEERIQRQPMAKEEELVQAKAGPGDVRQVAGDVAASQFEALVQRQETQSVEDEKELLQTKANPGAVPAVSSEVQRLINHLDGRGHPLDPSTRSFMELRFDCDFSHVRIHTGSPADELTRSVHSRAFTLGNNIVFSSGQEAPNSLQSRRLLAHELVHVIQQSTNQVPAETKGPRLRQAGVVIQRLINLDEYETDILKMDQIDISETDLRGALLCRSPNAIKCSGILPPDTVVTVTHRNTQGGWLLVEIPEGKAPQGERIGWIPEIFAPPRATALPRSSASPPAVAEKAATAPCTWPPNYSARPPDPYSKLDPSLLQVLKASFDEHSPSNNYLANAFWGPRDEWDVCQWPQTLWKGLGIFDSNALSAVTQVFGRAAAIPGLWKHIERIKQSWWSSSRGFKMVTDESTLGSFLNKSRQFCRDSAIGSSEHPGQTCWRELGRASVPGLHICLGGSDHDIHIDPTQVAAFAEAEPGFPTDLIEKKMHAARLSGTRTCVYDLSAVSKHLDDLKDDEPTTVFQLLERMRKTVETLKQEKLTDRLCEPDLGLILRLSADGIIEQLPTSRIREFAIQGEVGLLKARRLLKEVKNEHARLFRLSSDCR